MDRGPRAERDDDFLAGRLAQLHLLETAEHPGNPFYVFVFVSFFFLGGKRTIAAVFTSSGTYRQLGRKNSAETGEGEMGVQNRSQKK